MVACRGEAITAQQAVLPDLPKVAQLGDDRAIAGEFDRLLFLSFCFRLRRVPEDKLVDLASIEADCLDIEIDILIEEKTDFLAENIEISTCEFGELVVGNDIGPLLGPVHMRELDRRDFLQAKPLCRGMAGVPGEDTAFLVNDDRVVEPELPDRLGDQFNLLAGMRARLARIVFKRADRSVLDVQLLQARHASFPWVAMSKVRKGECYRTAGYIGTKTWGMLL